MANSEPQIIHGKMHHPSLDPNAINTVATALNREPRYVDSDGFECHLIAAAVNGQNGDLAYVETRQKGDVYADVDITTKIHLHRASGLHKSIDIQTWNPVFGCDVEYFKWFDDSALLIYREKHVTYVCRFGAVWPPQFVEIENHWLLKDSTLAHLARNAQQVQQLSFPELKELDAISLPEAEQQGLLPT